MATTLDGVVQSEDSLDMTIFAVGTEDAVGRCCLLLNPDSFQLLERSTC
jgi:hypothetical protein